LAIAGDLLVLVVQNVACRLGVDLGDLDQDLRRRIVADGVATVSTGPEKAALTPALPRTASSMPRQSATTRSLTSSSVRSRSGVMSLTSNQT
jgi:hypothetical protein